MDTRVKHEYDSMGRYENYLLALPILTNGITVLRQRGRLLLTLKKNI